MGFVYCLVDPRNAHIKYVGKSMVLTPKNRLLKHLQNSNLKPNTLKNNWIKKLKSLGLSPAIEVIENGFEEENSLNEAEIYYIRLYKILGHRITNGTNGGEGMLGYKHTESGKAKIGAANKGRIWTEESKLKSSKSHRGFVASEAQKEKFKKSIRKPESRRERSAIMGGRPFVDESGHVYGCLGEAQEKLGVDSSHLSKVLWGLLRRCKGHTFRYIDEEAR